MEQIKRRKFIGRLSAGLAGTAALGACAGKASSEKSAVVAEGGKNTLEENRKMPRELVFNMLDQKVNQTMKISYNCAQTSFLALQEQFGLEGGAILKALTPLTGIAERGETCGAVTGCLMCFGLLYGRDKNRLNDWEAYRKSLVPSGVFCDRFAKETGSTMCADIQKKTYGRCFHLTDPDELKAFQAAGATEKCSAVVRKAVRIAAAIILDQEEDPLS